MFEVKWVASGEMSSEYDALRAKTLKSGKDEEAVTVNTRALVGSLGCLLAWKTERLTVID